MNKADRCKQNHNKNDYLLQYEAKKDTDDQDCFGSVTDLKQIFFIIFGSVYILNYILH